MEKDQMKEHRKELNGQWSLEKNLSGLILRFASLNPVRLDLSAATVIIDRPKRQVPLQKLGSRRNWIVYDLVAHLALHKYFREQGRPVPGFLFLDQPTQAFFPPDRNAEMQGRMTFGFKDPWSSIGVHWTTRSCRKIGQAFRKSWLRRQYEARTYQ